MPSKKSVVRRTGHSSFSSRPSPTAEHLNHVLIENFTRLQKVLIHNAERMDALTAQITKLLGIFEISAKSFAEKNFRPSSSMGSDLQKEAEFLSKLNTLLDQNKTIAKGLSLLGEDFKEKIYGESQNSSPSVPKITIPQITIPNIPQMNRQRFERIDPNTPRMQVRESEPEQSPDNDSSSIDRRLPKV
jgi:hypothetical protein